MCAPTLSLRPQGNQLLISPRRQLEAWRFPHRRGEVRELPGSRPPASVRSLFPLLPWKGIRTAALRQGPEQRPRPSPGVAVLTTRARRPSLHLEGRAVACTEHSSAASVSVFSVPGGYLSAITVQTQPPFRPWRSRSCPCCRCCCPAHLGAVLRQFRPNEERASRLCHPVGRGPP